MTTDGPGTHLVSTGQASVTFTQDPEASSPTAIVFRPEGTCSVELNGSSPGCTVSASSTSCSLQTDRSTVTVLVDTSTDPPTYRYSGLVGADVMLHHTVTCPDGTHTYDAPTIEGLMTAPGDQGFAVDADGHTLRNGYSTGAGGITHAWTWDLSLDIPAPPR
jgi:hypothetical protein